MTATPASRRYRRIGLGFLAASAILAVVYAGLIGLAPRLMRFALDRDSGAMAALALAIRPEFIESLEEALPRGSATMTLANGTQQDLRPFPVYLAAKQRKLQVLQRLLDDGAEPWTGPDIGESALALAFSEADPKLLRPLREFLRDDPRFQATLDASLLESGSAGETRLLLSAGANPNAVDAKGVTALGRSMLRSNLEEFEALLSAGAKSSSPFPVEEYRGYFESRSPLYFALRKGMAPFAAALIARGEDPLPYIHFNGATGEIASQYDAATRAVLERALEERRKRVRAMFAWADEKARPPAK